MQLPVILNVNPRSLFNKQQQFKTYLKEKKVQLVCVSESWETDSRRIEDILDSDEFEVISNPYVRRGRGGRPAIIVEKENFNVENPPKKISPENLSKS